MDSFLQIIFRRIRWKEKTGKRKLGGVAAHAAFAYLIVYCPSYKWDPTPGEEQAYTFLFGMALVYLVTGLGVAKEALDSWFGGSANLLDLVPYQIGGWAGLLVVGLQYKW